MKKNIKLAAKPVILRITGSGIPLPFSTLFWHQNSPNVGEPLKKSVVSSQSAVSSSQSPVFSRLTALNKHQI